jgi:hypothetical protein
MGNPQKIQEDLKEVNEDLVRDIIGFKMGNSGKT